MSKNSDYWLSQYEKGEITPEELFRKQDEELMGRLAIAFGILILITLLAGVLGVLYLIIN